MLAGLEYAEPDKLREMKQGLWDQQKQRANVFLKKGVLKNFSMITGNTCLGVVQACKFI